MTTEHLGEQPGSFSPPLPSRAERDIAVTSRAAFRVEAVLGDGSGRGAAAGAPARCFKFESHTEYSWALVLAVRPDVAELREQVGFDWIDEVGKRRTHFFDLFVVRTDGTRIACAVRPAVRTGGRFGRQMPQIAAQARGRGFAEDVRLLTDRDLDPDDLHNARLLHEIRIPDLHADPVAARVVSEMSGTSTLAELTDQTGLEAAGFRALLRLVRSANLRPLNAGRITRATTVYKWRNL